MFAADGEGGAGGADLGPVVGCAVVLVEVAGVGAGGEQTGAAGVQLIGGSADLRPVGALTAPFEDRRAVGGQAIEVITRNLEIGGGVSDLTPTADFAVVAIDGAGIRMASEDSEPPCVHGLCGSADLRPVVVTLVLPYAAVIRRERVEIALGCHGQFRTGDVR